MTGDEERFEALVSAHHEAVQAYCLRRLPLHDANEAAADVFTVAWRRLADAPEDDERLPWLYGVAHNVVRNHKRSSNRRLRLAAKAGSIVRPRPDGPEAVLIRHYEHEEVHQALAELREEDQELLRLKAWEELSNRAIGGVLGISEQAVESRYARALARLAKRLRTSSRSFGISPLSRQRGEEAS